MATDHIEGGYILLARRLCEPESWLMDRPPLYFKLWVWMLKRAMWKDGDKLRRGRFVTTIAEMQGAMSYHIGYRKVTPTKDEIRNAYEAFAKAAMITTTKTTRGMIVTVCNYEVYQNPKSYESHGDPHIEDTAKPAVTPHDREEGEERKEKNTSRPCAGELKKELLAFFEVLWKAYPEGGRVKKKEALRHYLASVKTERDMDRIDFALGAYLEHLKVETWKKPQNGSTWFNNYQDWIPKEVADEDQQSG